MILEVHLEYPLELHDIHNDHPLAPESNKKDVILILRIIKRKIKYNLNRNLQLYTDLSWKVKKVHRVLEFNQSPWLKQYIDFNTQKRTQAKNSLGKYFFKLMNNSLFGKTMENLPKRVDVKLVTDEKKLIKLTSKPTFVTGKIFTEKLVAIHKIKEILTLNRLAYMGMCILDLSKALL